MSARRQISLQVAERARLRGHRAAVHARPDAVGPARRARDPVVQLPDLDPARVVPPDPLAVGADRPSPPSRGSALAVSSPERARAVVAVADALAAHARPAVVGEAVGMRALDDLAQHVGQVLVVVRAVDAGDVLLGGAIRLAVRRRARTSPGCAWKKSVGGAVRVHPRHHEEPVVVRRLRQLAEEVAAVEELRAMVQRELARVVGDDAAGVDDDGLDLRALPVRAPPGDVVADGILLGDVGLAPEIGAAIPRQRRRADRVR